MFLEKHNLIIKRIILFFAIVILGITYHFKYLNIFPSHIHAWAQADRYALALGFQDNNFNFFKPQTYVLNHQFPGGWRIPSGESITAVDFPIHDFIPAIFMKIFGCNSPVVFRLYILLYSFLGLFFLFKLAESITGSYAKGLLILILALTSPVFVYYQGGFLPTIPCLSNTIIGLFFYFKYLKEKGNSDFNLSIFFVTFAALSRTTFLISLLAILVVELIRIIRKETHIKGKLLPIFLSLAALVTYQIYNNYLRNSFGSEFLNYLLPPESLVQAKEILVSTFQNWGLQYFTWLHYLVFGIILSKFLIFSIMKRTELNNGIIQFMLLIGIMMMGYISFGILMLKQFPDHDYYFLDTFFLPVLLVITCCLSILPVTKTMGYIFVVVLSLILFFQPVRSQKSRMESNIWNKTQAVFNNFENATTLLNSLRIQEDARMLVIDAVAPNIPFILMQRKGYAVMSISKESIDEALNWRYDYIVIQNDLLVSDIYPKYPDLLKHLKRIGSNGKISICTYSKVEIQQSLREFLDLKNKKICYQNQISFEEVPDSSRWQNINLNSHIFKFGNHSGHLTAQTEFGITFKSDNIPVLTQKATDLFFSSWFLKNSSSNCMLVLYINSNGKHLYYNQFNLVDLLKQRHKWENLILFIHLPQITETDYEFGIYIWNVEKDELYYDNFGFEIY